MSFWTENNFEPKRAFRFKLNLGFGDSEENIPYFYVKTAAKPSFETTTTTHKVAGREFNFPGSVKWTPVDISFIDDVSNTTLQKIVSVIANSNYPDIISGALSGVREGGELQFLSKQLSAIRLTNPNSSLEQMRGTPAYFTIEQLNADGLVVESWKLHNPFIQKLAQDGLDYGKEDLNTYTLSIVYDWATFESST